ncbi:MAG: YhbY family RNA-binding protein [Firmicutes bacterium]|nr:YhbY family RNA-binding protein [Candidatus Colimorpha enterica]
MTGKERAALRAEANKLDTIQQIGHNGIGDETVKNVLMALEARELIKLRVLETSPVSAKEAASQLAEATGAEVIQVIGYRFVLYKYNPEKHKS